MTAYLLLKSLCDFLRQSVADYAAAQGDKGNDRIPEVFEWYLPFKNPRASEKIDYPYIVARIHEGQNTNDINMGSTVRIDLAFGIYKEGRNHDGFVMPDGAYDLLSLMEHTRISLFKQHTIDRRYSIEKPYKWQIPEEQPYPLWVGQAQTLWNVQSVIDESEEVNLYGQ